MPKKKTNKKEEPKQENKQVKQKSLVDKQKFYEIDEALELLPKISTSKFVGSAEIVINLRLSEKQKKQPPARSSVTFPHPFGEQKKVLVLTDAPDAAKKAGADFAGLDEFVKKIEKGWMGFDVVIATPKIMPQIAKLGKFLGAKGMMPNPKNQTVTDKVEEIVKQYKSGKIDFKANDQDAIKLVFGKLDMSADQLKANFDQLKKQLNIELSKYSGDVVRSIFMGPTMGPSIKLNPKELRS